MPATWAAIPAVNTFTRTVQSDDKVFLTYYDMVQAEMIWVRNLSGYDYNKEAAVDVFNNYFGGGMGSIVFQTIRESKALAYSTYAFVITPAKKQDPFAFIGYVGSQADKLPEAMGAMNELLNTLPERGNAFENGRAGTLKDIETERIDKQGIIFSYLAAQKKGLAEDPRKEKYTQVKQLSFKDIQQFHNSELAGKKYSYAVIGSEKNIKPDNLAKYGTVKTLTLEEIFGY